MTTKAARDTHGSKIDHEKQKGVEKHISEYMQKHFFFGVISVDDKDERLTLESKIISTVSHCTVCKPSQTWLGLHSTKEKIRASGLWLVNELYKDPLSADELAILIQKK
jgi:hypothetical protein